MEFSRKELFKYIGILGAAALLGGYLRYSITDVMGKLNAALMIGGGVLILLWIVSNYQEIAASSQKRSTRLVANSLVVTIAAVAIFGFVNYLGYKHHKKFDFTAEKLFTLSDQTQKVMKGLQSDIKVLYFNKTDEPVASFVEQYRDLSNRITYERVDIQARPEMASQFKGVKFGDTVVLAGKRNERLTNVDEQTLTSAIMKVTREKAKTIYFTEGHGEREISGGGPEGYLQVDGKLKADNYDTKSLNLVTSNKIPDDCSVLVLAGPKKPLLPPEAETIKKFLNDGGKVLMSIDPDADPELAELFKDWNIEARKDTVVDNSAIGQMVGAGGGVPLVMQYGSHPITKEFGRNAMTFYPLARSLKTETKGDVTVTELLKTSPDSFSETELQGNAAKFDEGKDTKGPLTLGAAATKKIGEKEARLVVIGDSDFASNAYQRQAVNGDLFVNSINWLAQEEDLISIRPKKQTDRNVDMSTVATNILFWLTVFMPLAIIGLGISIWWKRR